jgi:hypothetical protein
VKSANEKAQIEDEIKNQSALADFNQLVIPSLGIKADITSKKADDKIQLSKNGNRLILSGYFRTLGVTPSDTLRLSPLALLSKITPDSQIFVDVAGERLVFKVTEINQQVKPNLGITSDLAIYALNQDGSLAEVAVLAQKVGTVQ